MLYMRDTRILQRSSMSVTAPPAAEEVMGLGWTGSGSVDGDH